MSDRTQDLTNHRKVATACKNYVDNKITELKWELGSHTLDVESDTTTAYTKSVPSDTIGCQINKIGGMSYKSENLMVLTDIAETTQNGITYKVENGIIYLNGTSTQALQIIIPLQSNIIIPTSISNGGNGALYFGNNFIGSLELTFGYMLGTTTVDLWNLNEINRVATTYNLLGNKEVDGISINISASSTITNGTIKPMVVNNGLTNMPFKEGFEGIRDSAVTSVVSNGANLFNNEDVVSGYMLNSGNALVEDSSYFYCNYIKVNPSTTYIYNLGISFHTCFYDINKTYISGATYSDTFTTPSNCYYMRMSATLVRLNTLMIVKGSTAPSEYRPYVQPITKQIPSQIQALDGYGWGVKDTCYNYIDFENKKFVKKVGMVDLSSLNYEINNVSIPNVYVSTSELIEAKAVEPTTVGNLLAVGYTTLSRNSVASGTNDKSIGIGLFGVAGKKIYLCNSIFEGKTPAQVKELLSGVYLIYELATPIETDISEYLDDNSIEVEPLGTLTFTNTYEQAVPSDIDYLIEEVKA